MNQLKLILSFCAVSLFLCCKQESSFDKRQAVNPLIGDISYEAKFGNKPTQATDNHLRVETHLEYVENLLRTKDVSGLSNELIAKRMHLLNLLHEYWAKGVFPKNYDYAAERKPCFIDRDGTICAVGYLIEQTTSRETAEKINAGHKYEELLAMNDQAVDAWVQTSGLTKDECAMIQPTYGWPIPDYPSNEYQSNNYVSLSYGISSSIIGGLNLSLNTINSIQIAKGTKSKTVPIIGLLSGAGQIILGSASFPKEEVTFGGIRMTNESKKTLSFVNIGLGTTTMILSAWNLITNRKPKNRLTTWDIYSFPTQDNSTGLALRLTRKF